MYPRKYTDEQLIELVKTEKSFRAVALKLKMHEDSTARLKKQAIKLNLDFSHFLGQSIWKGRENLCLRKSVTESLKSKSKVNSHSVKLRLIRDGIKKPICENCQIETWNNLPVPLELHHKNGIHDDNRPENLAIICPNCHAQTPNYCSKNLDSYKMRQ